MIGKIALVLALVSGEQPYFKLPFPCGQVWSAGTYAAHWPNPHSLDMFHKTGPTDGQAVLAPATGILEYTGWWSGKSGWTVIIDHGGGWKTYFLHLREQSWIPQGQLVMQGQHVGHTGNSGSDNGRTYVPHLHYTVMRDGEGVQAVFSGEPTNPPATLASRNCGSSLDGDAIADLVVVHEDSVRGYPRMKGPGTVIGSHWGDPARTRFPDLDGDGDKEVVLLNDDGSGRVPQTGGTVPARIADPARMLFADLNGDRRDETVTVETNGELKFHFAGGATAVVGWGWFDPARVRFTDLNGDGRDDAVSLDPNGNVRAFFNVNGTYPGAGTIVATGRNDPSRVRFADTDGNGRDELIVFTSDGDAESYWNTGAGVFEEKPEIILEDHDPAITFLV
ncbi:MAG TPA: VCBS repeat domain-containing M23 family metallopeptidase [Candidatus Limnocylindrales bacterium]